MSDLADWMKSSWVHDLLVMNNAWAWPAMEIFHFFGLVLLFGALLVMDLRLLGVTKAASVEATSKLSIVAQTGFAINLFTGILFCFGNPDRYFVNPAFQTKMILLVLAGFNFLYFQFKIHPKLSAIGPYEDTPVMAKLAGGASLLLWIGVLVFGRLIAYLGIY